MGRDVPKTNGGTMATIPVTEVPLKKITNARDWPIVPGEVMHECDRKFIEKVDTYKKILKDGGLMPPIVCYKTDNRSQDGQCRYEAHKQLGRKHIMVIWVHEVPDEN